MNITGEHEKNSDKSNKYHIREMCVTESETKAEEQSLKTVTENFTIKIITCKIKEKTIK